MSPSTHKAGNLGWIFLQFKSEGNQKTESDFDSFLFQAANSFASLLQKSKIKVLSIQGVYDLFVDARVPLNEIKVCMELFSLFFHSFSKSFLLLVNLY